jgi:hypothetical protein
MSHRQGRKSFFFERRLRFSKLNSMAKYLGHGHSYIGIRNDDFYDERVLDGGTCYFLVYFVVKTMRYSTVVFHGYG